MSGSIIHVVKLGGSLLDLPDLAARWSAYRDDELAGQRCVLIVGGGRAADMVRWFDQHAGFDETTAHWLAVRAMQLNAHIMAAALRDAVLVADPAACEAAWQAGRLAVVDPLVWLQHEAAAGVHIPHRWQFTSDSIAAHVAQRLGAAKLTLLKPALPASETCTLTEAMEAGLVDDCFPEAARGLPQVALVNLRQPGRPRCRLRAAP